MDDSAEAGQCVHSAKCYQADTYIVEALCGALIASRMSTLPQCGIKPTAHAGSLHAGRSISLPRPSTNCLNFPPHMPKVCSAICRKETGEACRMLKELSGSP